MAYTTLISTDVLASHLSGDWIILDCRYDLQAEAWGRAEYRRAHVPGAQYVSLGEDLAGPRTGRNGRHPIPSCDALAGLFGRLGITPRTQVAAYDQDSGMYASRLWWSLRYLGHEAVALVDGGWTKWMREGRAARTGDETRRATVFLGAARTEMRVDLPSLESPADASAPLLVDARAPERFAGLSEPIDRAAGHIPGAVNHHYRSNLADDGTLLPPGALRARFERLLSGTDPSQVIVYCGSGVTACHNLLAMERAGLGGARLYPGSWSEWSSDPDRPIETGPSSR